MFVSSTFEFLLAYCADVIINNAATKAIESFTSKGPSTRGDLSFDFSSVHEIVRKIVRVEGNLTEFLVVTIGLRSERILLALSPAIHMFR